MASVNIDAKGEAAEHYRAALQLRDLKQTTDVKFKLGQAALKLGDRAAARQHLESALRQANAQQDAWSVAYARAHLKILDAEV